ncbi:uncharacterized protein THITE_2111841 [Thermothielavioides terrestris NRRL 8126]|uniref:Uncharacterized protein n=1 Tax=Thermothielavioides terrestris (strain ATCC 38088 / NRRL 8126) TaxID=578455 RepID=G2R3P2_THETT|nr:uncharacterized protein THITE_2111841 [Thermothielavioides terrestris NRRL 8126]AEO65142.1 hypothetical protein THITE_2111841 [Thermothielavioides terrestris NRRL 8126]
MGNAQSIEAPRRTRASQKLSKPKTGNHATAGLLSPSSFSYSSRRLSSAQLPNPPAAPSLPVVSTPTTSSAVEGSGAFVRRADSGASLHSSPSLPRESRRRSLFRSRSSRAVADSLEPSHNAAASGAWIVDRFTRTNSMTYESAIAHYGHVGPDNWPFEPESRTSWNYNLSSYEAKRLLNLDEQPGLERVAAMAENKMTVITETTWKSSNPAQPPSALITRTSSDASLCMPVRRRSIVQTPGVATRSNSVRDLPPLPQLNFRHSHPPTPSLSRQPSVESYRSGIRSMPPPIQDPDAQPRAVTPCEDKYLSIGAFKLGSLRITNGSPSTVTSENQRSQKEERSSAGNDAPQDGYFSGAQGRETCVTSTAATRDLPQSPPFLPEISRSPPWSPIQSDLASPSLQTTSKVTALEDKLFDDEAQPEYSSPEVLDIRLDPNAKPLRPPLERDTGSTITRTDSGFVSTSSPTTEAPHKPLAKADSGYSSNVSLRSFQAGPQASENQVIPVSVDKQLSQSSSHQDTRVDSEPLGLGQTEISYPEMPGRESPPPPVPPKDIASRQPRLSAVASTGVSARGLVDENRTNSPKTTRQVPNPRISIPAVGRGPLSPGSLLQSPGSIKSSTSDNSSRALSIGGGSQRPGRLQRLISGARRSVAGPPTVHATHAVEQSTIPPVPREVENKLQEHARRFPTAAKRLALKPRASLDTLKTIFSMGSMEARLDAVNSRKTVPAVAESDIKAGAWKQTLNSVPASIANVAAHVIPRKPISRKPVPVRQDSAKEGDQEASGSRGNGVRSAMPASPVDSNSSLRSPKPRGRTVSLTSFPGERGTQLRRPASDFDLARSTLDLPSPPLPSPVAKAMSAESKARTSRPVTAARRPESLRIPPPLRPRSSTASLTRKDSRDSIQSYAAMQTLASKTSVDSLRSYASSQPGVGNSSVHSRLPSVVSMDPRRLQSFRQRHSPQSPPYDSPNWEVQTENGMVRSRSQTSAASGSRRNSISSVHSEGIYRPVSIQEWQFRAAQQQPLRHRASYDGYSYQQRFPQRGYPPSMSNGYTAPVKPAYDPRSRRQLDAAATWSRSQVDAAAGQWYQDGRLPPYAPVPRGHYRNRSVGAWSVYGVNPPYRVLHSYNSPAYRNVPIWG